MKRFRAYLTEIRAQMTPERAMEVLGLSKGFTADDLKRAWRDGVKQAHTDRGGSDERIREVNNAKDELEKRVSGGAPGTVGYKVDWEAINKEIDALATVIEEKMAEKINVAGFELHFEKLFAQPFSSEATFYKRSKGTSHVTYYVKVHNDTNSIVANLRLTADVNRLRHQEGKPRIIADPEQELDITLSTDITIERRQIKLFQKSFVWGQSEKTLNDVEMLFPEAKFKQKIAKSKERKMKKADYLGTFRNELGANISEEGSTAWVYVAVGSYTIVLYRMVMTFHRTSSGSYNFHGVRVHKYGDKDAQKSKKYSTVPETPEAFNWLVDQLKNVQRVMANDEASSIRDKVDAIFETGKGKFKFSE